MTGGSPGETYLKAAGKWTYLCRAAGQHGQVIDVLLSARRNLATARRFFTRALRAGTIPAEVTTERAAVSPAGARQADPLPLEYSIAWLTCTVADRWT